MNLGGQQGPLPSTKAKNVRYPLFQVIRLRYVTWASAISCICLKCGGLELWVGKILHMVHFEAMAAVSGVHPACHWGQCGTQRPMPAVCFMQAEAVSMQQRQGGSFCLPGSVILVYFQLPGLPLFLLISFQ